MTKDFEIVHTVHLAVGLLYFPTSAHQLKVYSCNITIPTYVGAICRLQRVVTATIFKNQSPFGS